MAIIFQDNQLVVLSATVAVQINIAQKNQQQKKLNRISNKPFGSNIHFHPWLHLWQMCCFSLVYGVLSAGPILC